MSLFYITQAEQYEGIRLLMMAAEHEEGQEGYMKELRKVSERIFRDPIMIERILIKCLAAKDLSKAIKLWKAGCQPDRARDFSAIWRIVLVKARKMFD
jgi:hypothetical protein